MSNDKSIEDLHGNREQQFAVAGRSVESHALDESAKAVGRPLLETSFWVGDFLDDYCAMDSGQFAGMTIRSSIRYLQLVYEIDEQADEFLVNSKRVSLDHYELNYGDEVRIIHGARGIVSPTLPTQRPKPQPAAQEAKRTMFPHWDSITKRLYVGKELIKDFAKCGPHTNQVPVIEQFERAGWRKKLEDPLGGKGKGKFKRTINETVAGLNNTHKTAGRLLFHAADGIDIWWEITKPSKGRGRSRKAKKPSKGQGRSQKAKKPSRGRGRSRKAK